MVASLLLLSPHSSSAEQVCGANGDHHQSILIIRAIRLTVGLVETVFGFLLKKNIFTQVFGVNKTRL